MIQPFGIWLLGLGTFVCTLTGGLIALRLGRNIRFITGLSAGAVVGLALFELIPEAAQLRTGAGGFRGVMLAVGVGFCLYMAATQSLKPAGSRRLLQIPRRGQSDAAQLLRRPWHRTGVQGLPKCRIVGRHRCSGARPLRRRQYGLRRASRRHGARASGRTALALRQCGRTAHRYRPGQPGARGRFRLRAAGGRLRRRLPLHRRRRAASPQPERLAQSPGEPAGDDGCRPRSMSSRALRGETPVRQL